MQRKKASDEVIKEAYLRLKSVWLAGKEIGIVGQTVHERCVKLGIIPIKKYQHWQIEFAIKNYGYYADRQILDELCELLIIDKPNLVRIVKKYGVKTTYFRKLIDAKSKKKLYSIYMTMVTRCENSNSKHYKIYGGRGIKNKFNSLDDFISTMGDSYTLGLTLDIIDVNGHYEPSNCRWATHKQQANNKRNNTVVNFNGNNILLNLECNKLGIKTDTIKKRIFIRNWSVERALTEPLKIYNTKK